MCRSVENLTRKYEERGEQRGRQQGIQQGMQQGMQQGIQQGIQQGMQQGVYAQAIETARKMLLMKSFPVDMIAKLNGLSVEEVEKLAKAV